MGRREEGRSQRLVGGLRPWDGTLRDVGNILDEQGHPYSLMGPVKNSDLLLKKY